MPGKTTMTDIAEALGVSQTLVSFVLSGKNDKGISSETKKKVLQAAEKMGYCSNTYTKMLRLGRSGYMALVFSSDVSSVFTQITENVCAALKDYGYLAVIQGKVQTTGDAEECVKLFSEKRADGFILYGANSILESALTKALVPYTVITGVGKETAEEVTALCTKVLSCTDEKKTSKKRNTSESKKAGAAKKTAKKVVPEKAQEKETPPARKKDSDSIWLL